jgi:hypothetical protein
VKAAYLYNFAHFVTWPPGRQAEKAFSIGIAGPDPFGGALEKIVAGKAVNRRPILITQATDSKDIEKCHILFIPRSEQPRLPTLLAALRGKNVLTVGETEDFIEAGGMIRFVLVDGSVKFEINPKAAEAVGLQVSSKLLNVAKIVHPSK